MPQPIDLTLCIYHINPQARYRLSGATPPHAIIEWLGPGEQPTQAELEAAWVIVSDPDWLDPNLDEATRKAIEAHRDLVNTPGWVDWTVDQVEEYIDHEVTSIRAAKRVLKAMGRLLVNLRDFTRILEN